MPSPERPEAEPRREQEPTPYHQAAWFAGEQPAARAYNEAQHAIYTTDSDLSVFRFQLSRVYHVAVLGELPPEELQQRLQSILSRGQPASLPGEVLKLLEERRAQAIKLGTWVERHHRPGKPL